ncbi:ABC transporter ATP-binding protein [Microvirga flavescens]|uniref:ABC transporter ATP-binding protein n=1 Tax=Microvirga flavescens TaxID=2249811 RepID=UPI0018E091D5|nr:ABC transporter ATP-binding protein [Microvirga flavescens]
MAAALEIRDLAVVYQGVIQALTNLSLRVPEGSIVALLGANGAGKTTTLKAVSGFLPLEDGRVTRGSITLGGQDILKLAPHMIVRRGIFHVREGRHIFSEMTVEENLIASTFAQRKSRPRKDAFDEVYNYFPILSQRRNQAAGYLSGGEQQMLAIGRALVADPEMILLDEPSLGLAPLIVQEIFEIVAQINREKKVSILLVEQNAVIALKYASYGYVIENGRTVMAGSTEELSANEDIQKFYLGVETERAA